MSIADPYATAKTNLRENVKILSTLFAGIAAVILAGTPFSGFGGLPIGSVRFFFALGSLITATAFLFAAVYFFLHMLRPDLVYARWLRSGFNVDVEKDKSTHRELVILKAAFELNKNDLLPEGLGQLESLEMEIERLWQVYRRTNQENDQKIWESYQDSLSMILYWAAFTRLHQRISDGMKIIFILCFFAIAAIATFASAANPPKSDINCGSISIVRDVADTKATTHDAPRFDPVFFELGKADMALIETDKLRTVRDYLRNHPNAGLLIYAHTDTLEKSGINRELAKRRAKVVSSLLVGEGGIAATRIFVSELPQRDLPAITGPQVARDENRSVELALVTLPER